MSLSSNFDGFNLKGIITDKHRGCIFKRCLQAKFLWLRLALIYGWSNMQLSNCVGSPSTSSTEWVSGILTHAYVHSTQYGTAHWSFAWQNLLFIVLLGKPSNRIFGKIWEFGPTRSTPKSKIGLQQLILAAKRYVSFFGSPCIKNKSKQCRRVKIDDVAVPCLNDTVSANMPKARGGQLLFLRKEGNWSPILRMLPER